MGKNRVSPNDSFWAAEGAETKNETLENYVDKLDKLTAQEYDAESKKFSEATPVLVVTWFDESGEKPKTRVELRRVGSGKDAEYYADSEATRMPVKISKFVGEQIERDLPTALAD